MIPSTLCSYDSRSNWREDEEFPMDNRALVQCAASGQSEELVVGTTGTNRLDWVCLSPRILVLRSWIKALSRIERRFSGPFAIPQTSAWES